RFRLSTKSRTGGVGLVSGLADSDAIGRKPFVHNDILPDSPLTRCAPRYSSKACLTLGKRMGATQLTYGELRQYAIVHPQGEPLQKERIEYETWPHADGRSGWLPRSGAPTRAWLEPDRTGERAWRNLPAGPEIREGHQPHRGQPPARHGARPRRSGDLLL